MARPGRRAPIDPSAAEPIAGSRPPPFRATVVAGLLLCAVTAPAGLGAQETPAASSSTELVTVSFRETPMPEVLRTFAELSGRSIVAGPEVAGVPVTAEIREQSWDVAMRAILDAHGLGARETEEGILQVSQASVGVRQDSPAPPLVSRVVRINYGRADEIAGAVEPHLGEWGRISVLPHLNAVLVTDLPAEVEETARLIGRPD